MKSRNLYLGITGLLCFINIAGTIIKKPFFGDLVHILCAVGIFQYLSWYAVYHFINNSDPKSIADRRDYLGIMVSFMVLPFCLLFPRAFWITTTGIALYWVFMSRDDSKLRTAGIILGALSTQGLWGMVFFDLVAAPYLLPAETAVVGTLMSVVRSGTIWQNTIITDSNGFGLQIFSGCSSFHNLSLATLCWLTINRLQHQSWQIRDCIIGGVIGGMMILLNVLRLCLMAWNLKFFYYWHDGAGAEIFAVSASLMMLLMSLYGKRLLFEPRLSG
jgi:hypothetical protein